MHPPKRVMLTRPGMEKSASMPRIEAPHPLTVPWDLMGYCKELQCTVI